MELIAAVPWQVPSAGFGSGSNIEECPTAQAHRFIIIVIIININIIIITNIAVVVVVAVADVIIIMVTDTVTMPLKLIIAFEFAHLFLDLTRVAQIVAAWLQENEKMKRKWRESEEMERDSICTFPHFLFISSFSNSIHFLHQKLSQFVAKW